MSKIVSVIQNSTGKEISAQAVLDGNEKKFSFERMTNAHHRLVTGCSKYSCPMCNEPLSIKTSQNSNRFFSHNPNSPDCEWKTDDERPDIPSELTSSEGRLHKYYKAMIQLALSRTDDVEEIDSEVWVYIDDAKEKHRQPDVQCKYKGVRIAFEVQVSYLTPEEIVAREKDYESIGWKLIWLLPMEKRFITREDILNSPYSNAFVCSISSTLVDRWEKEQTISFQCPVWKPSIGYSKVVDGSEYHTFNLDDVITSLPEDDGDLMPSDFNFPKGTVKYLIEVGTENLLNILSCPDDYRSLSNRTPQDLALDDYFLRQLKFTKNLKNAVRLIGSIKVGKSLWEIEGNFERVLRLKFYPRAFNGDYSLNNKYSDFLPAALAVALTYNPDLLDTEVFDALKAELHENEIFEDVETPLDSIIGRGSELLLAMFPRLSMFWEERFIKEYLRHYPPKNDH
ncbi:competence protein CoiA family protein [Shewanella sp.]|uniref:competence protein CoiA family protein n=1 Tax=Shewanella sp. TaxID=50422 RepID=UPI004048EA6F